MAASEAFTTDASGAYRAFNLPPGEYVIAAAVTNDLFGRGSIHRPTVAEIDASLFALQQGRSGAPAVPLPFPPSGPLTQQAYGWAPVFYPGTTSAADAGPVRVRAGEVHDDVDFAIDVAPHLTVAGAVFLPDGTAAPATKAISRIGPPLPVYAKSSTASQAQLAVRRSNLSGLVRASPSEFTFADVTPGLYAVAARHEDGSWAAANVRVIDRDIRDLRLVLQPPLSLSGHVRFDRPAEALLGDPPTLRVGLVPLPPDPGTVRVAGLGSGPVIGLPAPPPVTVAPDGTFSVRDILPGRLTIEVTDASGVELTGWWLASAAIDGRDLLDQPLDFGAKLGTLENVVLTLTHRRTELTGRLQTADGQAATGFHVIVFSADRTHWFPGARRTRAVRPASDGLFTVPELPAGAYLVAAVTDAIDDEWQQAAFLEQLAAFAAPVTVRAGQTVRQDLQIARPQTQGDAAR